MVFGSGRGTTLLVSVAALVLSGPVFAGPVLNKIKQTGTLHACIKRDYKPFGFLGKNGEGKGLEHDLVADVAQRLGKKFNESIKIDKIAVTSANRIQFLKKGKCQLLIATMTDLPARRKLINIVKPDYYAAGVGLLKPKGSPIKSWDDIRGKTICSTQGAFWNKPYRKKYNVKLRAYNTIQATFLGVKNGRCSALLADSSLISAKLAGSKSLRQSFTTVGKAHDVKPWGVAVAYGDKAFYNFMSQTVTDWHRNGTLIKLQKKWGIKPIPWTRKMHQKYANQSSGSNSQNSQG